MAFIQKKIAELNKITYKDQFPIFIDASNMNENTAYETISPQLNSKDIPCRSSKSSHIVSQKENG